MKLLRFGPRGQERPGLLDGTGNLRDLGHLVPDLGGDTARASRALQQGKLGARRSLRRSYPAPRRRQDGLGGRTGRDHRRPALYVSEAEALTYVAEYCTVNDVSERSFQKERSGQWVKGKSAPGFGPVGPWLVTADEVPDPQALRLRLTLNGQTVQDDSTVDMIFSVAEIVSHLSQHLQLLPGDIIATGTPAGVGMGMSPQQFLRPGDVMEAEVEGLGRQRQTVRAAA